MSVDDDGEVEPETYYEKRIDSMDDVSTESLVLLAIEFINDEQVEFEHVCRALSFGEAYLPLPNEDGYSKYYSAVYSRLVSRATRLRREGERMAGEKEALIADIESFSEYATDASEDEMESFVDGLESDGLDGVTMFWDRE